MWLYSKRMNVRSSQNLERMESVEAVECDSESECQTDCPSGEDSDCLILRPSTRRSTDMGPRWDDSPMGREASQGHACQPSSRRSAGERASDVQKHPRLKPMAGSAGREEVEMEQRWDERAAGREASNGWFRPRPETDPVPSLWVCGMATISAAMMGRER